MEDTMRPIRILITFSVMIIVTIACSKKEDAEPMIKGEEVSYQADSLTFKGYLVKDHAATE